MNLLFTCIGKRGYIADYFRPHLRPGEKIIGTATRPGRRVSRRATSGLCCPPGLRRVCARHRRCLQDTEIGGLLSFFDPDVMILSEHLDQLQAAGVVPMIPVASAARTCFDKWLTFQTLRRAGFPVPNTTIDIEEARQFRLPVIVKPRTGYGSANVFVANNRAQLESFFSYVPAC